MGSAILLFPFRELLWRATMGDLPPGFRRVEGTASLMVDTTPAAPGDCPRCQKHKHPDCDGDGTVAVGQAFRECPYQAQRDLEERKRPPG